MNVPFIFQKLENKELSYKRLFKAHFEAHIKLKVFFLSDDKI